MIWLFTRLGLSGALAGVVISLAFELGTLILLWTGFLRSAMNLTNVLTLALAAFFFGQVYYRAVFPISTETFLMLLALWFLLQRRWWAAGVAGAGAAFVYPTGALLAPVAAVWVLLSDEGATWRRRLSHVLMAGAPVLAGFLAVLLIQKVMVGAWGAFFRVQAKYGYHGLDNPSVKFLTSVRPLLHGPFRLGKVPGLQTLVVAVTMLALLIATILREDTHRVDWLFAMTAVVFWLFPLATGGRLHLYRSEALLLPASLLLPRVPIPIRILIVASAVALAYPMSILFYRGVLV